MKVKRIMHKHLVTVLNTASISDAAMRMKEENVGSVLIMSEDGRLEGIVTDRDIAMAVAANARDPKTACVADIMSTDPVAVNPDTDIDAALRIMNRANVRRLPVCENGNLVGMLSSADVATEMREELNQFIGLEEAFAKH